MSDCAAADWISGDDFKGIWAFFEKENPSTKFDVLACVCSFAVERFQKREKLSRQKEKNWKRVDESPRPVLNCSWEPKKNRSKRPRSTGRIELDLNPNQPLKKKLKDEDGFPDLGLEKVPDLLHKGDTFMPKIVQTLDHKLLVPDLLHKGDTFVPEIVQTIDHKLPMRLKKKKMPDCLRDQIEKMNGMHILLLGEKALSKSDVNSSLSRLMIPESQMVNSWKFLTDKENAFLKIKNGNNWNGLNVSLIEPPSYSSSSSSSVILRRWEMMKENGKSSCISCVLTSGWNQVVRRNQLESGSIVQVWSFRVDKELHLALVVI